MSFYPLAALGRILMDSALGSGEVFSGIDTVFNNISLLFPTASNLIHWDETS